MNPVDKLHNLGQSIWYDNIERALLENGELKAMIVRGEIRGVTSNPSIFNNAIANSNDYDDDLASHAKSGASKEEIYESLVVEDIQNACDLFRNLYDKTYKADGYVSLEVSPYLAYDTQKTIDEAARLWERVNRPNLMIKIPATKEGLPAITETISAGINVNVTLIFSIERYKGVMTAYMHGLERRLNEGYPIDHIASVASFFVSRIDSNIDQKLEKLHNERADALRGKIAVANAKLAYAAHKQSFSSELWIRLDKKQGHLQRPLWASTSTKNPAYPDTKYVDELIGPNTVNTMPPSTLVAFLDHGTAELTLDLGLDEAERAMENLDIMGVSMDEVTQELEEQGVKSFADSYTSLLETLETRLEVVA